MEKTEKLYYNDPFLSKCSATVTHIDTNKIYLDKTVAFPEGGGQIADTGTLIVNNKEIPFLDVQKGLGRPFITQDFPVINLDTPIYHVVSENNASCFNVGDNISVMININRRIMTTVHHSALHLALMFLSNKRPEISDRIKGCSITETNARLDFFAPEKFSPEQIQYTHDAIIEIIKNNEKITVYPHEKENEAWYWKCREYICPCGGTHITNTEQLGNINVRRKGIGKGSERLIVEVTTPMLSENHYH
jgi:alanyl-tRNA synthetase